MRPEHHYFVFEIGSGYLGDHVMTHQVLIVVFRRDVEFESNLRPSLHHSNNAIVVFGGNNDLRNKRWCVFIANRFLILSRRVLRIGEGGGLNEHRSAVAAPRLEYQRGALIL